MDMQRTVILATLGTTAEPVLKALETASAEGALTLFLVYGRALPDQDRAPLVMANTISERAQELGVTCRAYELNSPEEFEGCCQFFQNLMNEVSQVRPDRIIIDVTGGTKVMSAALVHTALVQQLGAEVIFEYVGGPRNMNGRVSSKDMTLIRDKGIITLERATVVLVYIKRQDFARAAFMAESLPKLGKASFLRKAAAAFWRWDNFHYEEALPLITEALAPARILIEDRQYSKVAGSIMRLNQAAGKVKLAVDMLRQLKTRTPASLAPAARDGWLYILSDVIANARRRVHASPIDSVLRSYRATEVATQIALFKLGINPWQPDWNALGKERLAAYLLAIRSQEPPWLISLDVGIKLIETLRTPFAKETTTDVRDIMTARNFSYLEHGYDGVTEATAQNLLAKMEMAVKSILAQAAITEDPVKFANELRIEA